VEGSTTVKDLVLNVRQSVLEAYENQDYPFDKLTQYLFPGNENKTAIAAISTIFCSMLNLHDDRNVENINVTLSFCFFRTGSRLAGHLVYDADSCTENEVTRFSSHFVRLLAGAVENVNLRVSDISFLGAEEKRQLLEDFNNNRAEFSRDRTIHHFIEDRAEKTPDASAIAFDNEEITYRYLNSRANRLAGRLQEKGVKEDGTVGILMDRSPRMVESILAVWKAGGAYIPIDPAYPHQRVLEILNDSHTRVLITLSLQIDPRLEASCKARVIKLNEFHQDARTGNNAGVSAGEMNIGSLAYVIYTSGSTGKPKGAMVEHIGMMNHMSAKVHDLQLTGKSIVVQNASHTFDISVWQFFAVLTLGGKTIICSDELVFDPERFIDRLIRCRVTILEVVPSYLSVMLEFLRLKPRKLETLRYLLVTGETVKPGLVRTWFETYPDIPMVNAYGPTEASDDITHFIMNNAPGGERIAIGKPIRNLDIYIVDKNMNLCPVGVKGEIWVSGVGVGRGYLNDHARTREVFTRDPFNHTTGVRLYKTGDLGRWLADGTIEFFGRIDHQVKIRGFRIELGEIECQLSAHPGVKEAVVIVKDSTGAGGNDDTGNEKYLCAFLVPAAALEVSEVRAFLAQRLPDYMVPDQLVQLKHIPLTPNGKIDRKALSQLDAGISIRKEYAAPRNQVEEKLVDIWSVLLGKEKETIGIDANFFEMGGHSLKATILVSKIHKKFNVNVPLNKIFEFPTIRELAHYLDDACEDRYEAIKAVEKKEYYNVSSAQKRLYILQQLAPESTVYNMPGTIALKKELDSHRLEKAFKQLVKRHESFRTSFEIVNDEPIQKVHDHVEFTIEYSNLDLEEQNRQSRDNIPGIEKMIRAFVCTFILSKAPLLRVGLIRTPETVILLVDMHHIISDGISHRILEEELIKMYNGEELTELRWQYKDYSEWYNRSEQQQKVKNQEKHWLDCFSGDLPVLNLPCDYLRPAVQRFEGNSINFVLSEKETEGIKELAKITGTTLYMVTLSIYNILLSKLSGQEDIIVGTPIAARRHPDLERIIGMFVNTLAMRNFPSGDKRFKGFLNEVKEQTLAAYNNQEYQFEDLVEKLSIRRDPSRNPVFGVMFNFLEKEDLTGDFAQMDEKNNYQYENRSAKFDLNLRAIDLGERLHFNLEYSRALFKQETIEILTGYFKQIAKEIILNPGVKILDIEIFPEESKNKKINHFNGNFNERSGLVPIQVRLQDNFREYRNKVAIEYGNTQVTYAVLENKAGYITRWLRGQNIGKGTFIGLYINDKVRLISTIIGILNAGCVFVPLDTRLPVKRVLDMVQTANTPIVFTDTGGKNAGDAFIHLKENHFEDKRVVVIDDSFYKTGKMADIDNSLQEMQYNREDNVYVYFTSGSTGKPKGIVGKNESLVQFIQWEIETFSIDETYRVSQLAAVGFDAFLRNVFSPLLAGGTVCIPPSRDLVLDSEGLVDWLDANRVTLIHCVPAVFYLINSEPLTSRRFSHLKYILISGDHLHPKRLQEWYDIFTDRIQLVNCYGATETTIIKTFHFIQRSDVERSKIPAGFPMSDTRVIVLNRNLEVCPRGVMGEIYIRTSYRTSGYLDEPELTAEYFIKNPFLKHDTDIVYKTGDLGRELPDGSLEIWGRVDRQIKIRGVRVEPGEIENRLSTIAGVREAIVIDRTDKGGNSYLCAYIIPGKTEYNEASIDFSRIRKTLSENFPDYMIPTYFIKLEKIPLTPNGKIDRNALPEPEAAAGDVWEDIRLVQQYWFPRYIKNWIPKYSW
jgi:amino acid adenylation domain-containing protein